MAFNQNWSNTPATWATVSSLWGQAYGAGSDSLGLTVSEANAIQRAFVSADSLTLSAAESTASGLAILQVVTGEDTPTFFATESYSLDVAFERSDALGLLAVETTDAIQCILASEDQGNFTSGESSALVVEDWPYESLPPAISWGKSLSHSAVWVKTPPKTSEPW